MLTFFHLWFLLFNSFIDRLVTFFHVYCLCCSLLYFTIFPPTIRYSILCRRGMYFQNQISHTFFAPLSKLQFFFIICTFLPLISLKGLSWYTVGLNLHKWVFSRPPNTLSNIQWYNYWTILRLLLHCVNESKPMLL